MLTQMHPWVDEFGRFLLPGSSSWFGIWCPVDCSVSIPLLISIFCSGCGFGALAVLGLLAFFHHDSCQPCAPSSAVSSPGPTYSCLSAYLHERGWPRRISATPHVSYTEGTCWFLGIPRRASTALDPTVRTARSGSTRFRPDLNRELPLKIYQIECHKKCQKICQIHLPDRCHKVWRMSGLFLAELEYQADYQKELHPCRYSDSVKSQRLKTDNSICLWRKACGVWEKTTGVLPTTAAHLELKHAPC